LLDSLLQERGPENKAAQYVTRQNQLCCGKKIERGWISGLVLKVSKSRHKLTKKTKY